MLENEDIKKIIARRYGDISDGEKQMLFSMAKALDDLMWCFWCSGNKAVKEQA